MTSRHLTALSALLLLTAALLVGCGGGSSSTTSTSGGTARAGSSTGSSSGSSSSEASSVTTSTSTSAAGEPAEVVVAAEDPVSEGPAAVHIDRRDIPLLKDNDEISPTGAKPIKPCKLVTRPEARAILGQGTTSTEHPQGPTCVYSNAGRTVTLTVEVNSVKTLKAGARKATKVELDGRTGWCIKYQTTAVIVGISGGRVLRANGPCQAGVRFVSKALPRI
jgi:hypothetical protein